MLESRYVPVSGKPTISLFYLEYFRKLILVSAKGLQKGSSSVVIVHQYNIIMYSIICPVGQHVIVFP